MPIIITIAELCSSIHFGITLIFDDWKKVSAKYDKRYENNIDINNDEALWELRIVNNKTLNLPIVWVGIFA